MSNYIDQLFINNLSGRLERFSRKSDKLWNFRCPFCHDSQKHKYKARGYIYHRKGEYFFACHNGCSGLALHNFLKKLDYNLYREYQMETLKDSRSTGVPEKIKLPEIKTRIVTSDTINLPNIDSLPDTHLAKKFCLNRKIPKKYFSKLFYASDFREFLDEIYPNNDKRIGKEPRLIIPFYSEKNKLEGFQGRALTDSMAKYITILLDESSKKIYGLDTVNFSKPIYVVEGPIDSFFLDNALAAMDSALYNTAEKLGHDKNYIFIYDNEKRNNQIVANIKRTIDRGFSVFIWPQELAEYKDINEVILGNKYTSSELMAIIDKNTFNNLNAKLELSVWQK